MTNGEYCFQIRNSALLVRVVPKTEILLLDSFCEKCAVSVSTVVIISMTLKDLNNKDKNNMFIFLLITISNNYCNSNTKCFEDTLEIYFVQNSNFITLCYRYGLSSHNSKYFEWNARIH